MKVYRIKQIYWDGLKGFVDGYNIVQLYNGVILFEASGVWDREGVYSTVDEGKLMAQSLWEDHLRQYLDEIK